MGVFQNHLMGAAAAAAGGGAFYSYQIEQSCRMTKADSSYLRLSQGTPTSTTTFTWSMWLKRHGAIPASNENVNYFLTLGNSGSQYVYFSFTTGDVLKQDWQTGIGAATTNALFRDVTGWNHFIFRYDSTQSTEADRYRWYLNGSQLSFASQGTIAEDGAFPQIGSGNYIGHGYTSWTQGADVYLAEVHFCDGQSYAPSQFGETKNGVWIPKDPSGTTYGNNGYYLKFENASDLGNDSSGNNNDLTTSGLETNDQVLDSPTFGS